MDGQIALRPGASFGYVFQKDTLLPWRTVLHNVALPLELRGVRRAEREERAARLLAQFGLAGFERSYPRQLSGGMRQRTLLARTLVYEPDLLLLDEPLGALDAQTRLQLQEELREVCRTLGKTCVLVTHDLDEAISLSERVILLSVRPAAVQRVYPADLPRDLPLMELRSTEAFARLRLDIWQELSGRGATKNHVEVPHLAVGAHRNGAVPVGAVLRPLGRSAPH